MLRIEILGRLGRDPEMRYTPEGKAVTNISVATTRKWTGSDGEKHEETTWVRGSAWAGLAEVINQYFHKGDGIYIAGRLNPDENGNPRTYQRQDGSTGTSYEMTILDFAFPPGKSNGNGAPTGGDPAEEEEEIPF